jgi:hypothetical protein
MQGKKYRRTELFGIIHYFYFVWIKTFSSNSMTWCLQNSFSPQQLFMDKIKKHTKQILVHSPSTFSAWHLKSSKNPSVYCISLSTHYLAHVPSSSHARSLLSLDSAMLFTFSFTYQKCHPLYFPTQENNDNFFSHYHSSSIQDFLVVLLYHQDPLLISLTF